MPHKTHGTKNDCIMIETLSITESSVQSLHYSFEDKTIKETNGVERK